MNAQMTPYIREFQRVVAHLIPQYNKAQDRNHQQQLIAALAHERKHPHSAHGVDRFEREHGEVWLVHEPHTARVLIDPDCDPNYTYPHDERTLDRLDISATPWLVIVEYNDNRFINMRVHSMHATYAEACAAFLARVA